MTKTKTILLACAPLALLLHGPAHASGNTNGNTNTKNEAKRQPEAGDPLLVPPAKAAPALFKTGMSASMSASATAWAFAAR
jgi:hypothetical protein